ncbi:MULTISPECIES: type 1 glutamine amidotransferase [unclassified Gemella]|uniref:type 1 glutamine amidotransferase n=1 Tax=unclassified Gemella TaxID=2624949 RepID=UPI0010741303|nr:MULTISPECIES: glutamine amidotransferase [unclassified Gemella]MBF0710185.1 glutamine amidotransferase [Gemella sp. GL1.1]MBF0746485.1 glutamine amidotransferase [Gemella sp. 19428wG2_WT2a]NYS27529.1 glutamine amidotransferase [Gemella sp. GL1]TFU60265.1 glutamine amidotransferase [Gemella sp. WT2a]
MKLKLYHFMPDKLNLYGDIGNVISLKKRCEWRGIDLEVENITDTTGIKLTDCDMFFIGGGSDREQCIATEQFAKIKDEFKAAIEGGVPALTICGGYQFLGEYYKAADGSKLAGLNILDFYTESLADKPRLIGNILVESDKFGDIVGFENHGGRTYHNYDTLGSVSVGFGNNDDDKKEGILYNNLIGTYLHGPILPKNPKVSDFLIQGALDNKYGKGNYILPELNSDIELDANKFIAQQLRKSMKK